MYARFDCLKCNRCINALHIRLLLYLFNKIIDVYGVCDIFTYEVLLYLFNKIIDVYGICDIFTYEIVIVYI